MLGELISKIKNDLNQIDNKVFFLSYAVAALCGSAMLPGNFAFLFIPAAIILTPIIVYLGIKLTKQEVKHE
jgi:hypothetical protein